MRDAVGIISCVEAGGEVAVAVVKPLALSKKEKEVSYKSVTV